MNRPDLRELLPLGGEMAFRDFQLKYGKGAVSFKVPEEHILYELRGRRSLRWRTSGEPTVMPWTIPSIRLLCGKLSNPAKESW